MGEEEGYRIQLLSKGRSGVDNQSVDNLMDQINLRFYHSVVFFFLTSNLIGYRANKFRGLPPLLS